MIVLRQGRVEIFDTDASGLIFFGAATRWMADAEQDLLDAIGMRFPIVSVSPSSEEVGASAPTRSYEIVMDRPLGYLDTFDHETWVSRVGTTSYAISHRISIDGQTCVTGTVNRVYVQHLPGEGMRPAPVPEVLRRACCDGPGAS